MNLNCSVGRAMIVSLSDEPSTFAHRAFGPSRSICVLQHKWHDLYRVEVALLRSTNRTPRSTAAQNGYLLHL